MTAWIFVFFGGGLGSICRYYLARHFNYTGQEYIIFPYGTLIANILSCFILGFLIQKQISNHLTENLRLLLATGFCGGFSTFSTFPTRRSSDLRNLHLSAKRSVMARIGICKFESDYRSHCLNSRHKIVSNNILIITYIKICYLCFCK